MSLHRVKAVAIAAVPPGLLAAASPSHAASKKWVEAWTTGEQALYPAGYEVGQPGPTGPLGPNATGPLLKAAFPDDVARDQTLRMIIRPSIGGRVWRLRLTNVFGTQQVTFGHVTLAVQDTAGTIEPGTGRTLTFSGKRSVSVPAGQEAVSDPVPLSLPTRPKDNLAVSVHVSGTSGPMTWHAASFMTSYITDPGAGDHSADPDDEAFPHSTTSSFFLSGLEVRRADAATVVAFGDSITDGFFSTINGHDTWPDDLQRRLVAHEKAAG